MIKFHCESCNKKIGVNDSFVGKLVKCPSCEHPTRVPALESVGVGHAQTAQKSPPPRPHPKPATSGSPKTRPTRPDDSPKNDPIIKETVIDIPHPVEVIVPKPDLESIKKPQVKKPEKPEKLAKPLQHRNALSQKPKYTFLNVLSYAHIAVSAMLIIASLAVLTMYLANSMGEGAGVAVVIIIGYLMGGALFSGTVGFACLALRDIAKNSWK